MRKSSVHSNGLQETASHAQNEQDSPFSHSKSLAIGNDQIPTALHMGTLEIGDSPIACYVLDDYRRVLSGRAVTKAMGLTGRTTGMERFINKSLTPSLSEKAIEAIKNPIVFKCNGGIKAPLGYEAWLLPELCFTVIEAQIKGALTPQQKHMADMAKILIKAFSTVGIIALVDEATGYQEVRERKALQEILRRYISAELVEWALHFKQDFYREIFRLRGWEWNQLSTKRPVLVGKITRDIVYERLAPGVLEALCEKTPRDAKGRLKNKLFQYLTTDEGDPALDRHLHTVTMFMKASTSWQQFYRMLQRALPKCDSSGILIDVDDV